jgi:hypothetical protein
METARFNENSAFSFDAQKGISGPRPLNALASTNIGMASANRTRALDALGSTQIARDVLSYKSHPYDFAHSRPSMNFGHGKARAALIVYFAYYM